MALGASKSLSCVSGGDLYWLIDTSQIAHGRSLIAGERI